MQSIIDRENFQDAFIELNNRCDECGLFVGHSNLMAAMPATKHRLKWCKDCAEEEDHDCKSGCPCGRGNDDDANAPNDMETMYNEEKL